MRSHLDKVLALTRPYARVERGREQRVSGYQSRPGFGERLAMRFAERQQRGESGLGPKGDSFGGVMIKAAKGEYSQSSGPRFQVGDRVVHDLGFPHRKAGTVVFVNPGDKPGRQAFMGKRTSYVVKHDDGTADGAVREEHLAPEAEVA